MRLCCCGCGQSIAHLDKRAIYTNECQRREAKRRWARKWWQRRGRENRLQRALLASANG